ncbi:redoxin domain-containing protein [Aeoliella sp. SH292]|uniref:redoxin domain-containing protein n=1 Tax=Aeoliella sp. SH292 TaxID=3454464 RepID=UPI003F9A28D7
MRVVAACVASLLLIFVAAPVPAALTIEFPAESIGKVSIQPQASTDFGYKAFGSEQGGWQELGPAAGSVTIPDGHSVRLELNQAAGNQLQWIGDVPSDLIDAIVAYGVPIGDEGFAQLSQLKGLRYLSVSNAKLTSGIAANLPRLNRLQYLGLGSNDELGDEVMKAVAELPELQTIGINHTAVTDAGLELLARSTSLQAVYAGRTQISDSGLAAITQLPQLRALDFYAYAPELRGDDPNPSITDRGLAHLQRCPHLEHLNVSGSSITDDGLGRVAADCPQLRRLSLDDTGLTSKGLHHLRAFTELEYLRCYGTIIDDEVAEHLQSLSKLREITGDLELSNAGVNALTKLASLQKLSISGNCDDSCMASIAAMPSLEELSIQHTRVTDEGFAQMAKSATLQQIQITGNRMTTRCIETLATMPGLQRVGLMNVDPRVDGEPIWKQLESLSFVKTELWLCECPPLGQEDMAKLANFRDLASLRIDGGQALTDADLRHIQHLDKLKYLEITSSVVTDEGLKSIGSLSGLERLQINCLATEKGLEALAQAPRLRSLSIGSPNLTDAIVGRVQAAFPRLDSIRRMEFRLGGSEVSRSKSPADSFWREGTEEEREQLNDLEGKPAPALVVTNWMNCDQGTSLDQMKGRVVLVEFWGTWCGPCRARMPEVRKLHEEFAEKGLIVVGLHSTQAAEDAAEYVDANNIPWAIGLDDSKQTSEAYAVPHWPSFYLIDREGVLRMANPHRGELQEAVSSLLAEAQAPVD